MNQKTIDDAVGAAREALERHAWQEAFDRFSEADQRGALEPEDLELFGEAAWWAGHPDTVYEARERAHNGYLARGEEARAGYIAVRLTIEYLHGLQSSVAQGWLARARRLLANHPDAPERGYLERYEGVLLHELSGDPEAALERIRVALEIATRTGDKDLQAVALMDQGRILVSMGRLDEGRALMDEAMVAAVGGEISPFFTGVVYCNMIGSCESIADYKRAGEWTEAAKRWCERQSINGFPGVCRVHRAEIMRLRGAWAEAETEARQACAELADHNLLDMASEGFYQIGEIRLRMGDLQAAEDSFRQAHELGRDPNPGMALLRLAQGKPDTAWTSIRRAADQSTGRDRLARARLLPAYVEIAIAVDDLKAAAVAVRELEETAETFGTQALHAFASQARGSLLLAEGDAEGGLKRLRHAFKHWKEADAPYEAARVRVLVAEAAHALGDEETAGLELRAARSTFEKLGALVDARRASELLGEEAPARRVARTFMFTDIVGSTNLVEAIGDEAWEDMVRWHDHALRACFARNDGEEVDHAGDGFFVAFEDPESAVACAMEIQRSLAQHRREAGFAPQVRIGLHATEATERAGDYGGMGVHQAARVGALAEGGEILATVGTLEAAGGGFAAGEAREVRLKGIADPVTVAAVEWKAPSGADRAG